MREAERNNLVMAYVFMVVGFGSGNLVVPTGRQRGFENLRRFFCEFLRFGQLIPRSGTGLGRSLGGQPPYPARRKVQVWRSMVISERLAPRSPSCTTIGSLSNTTAWGMSSLPSLSRWLSSATDPSVSLALQPSFTRSLAKSAAVVVALAVVKPTGLARNSRASGAVPDHVRGLYFEASAGPGRFVIRHGGADRQEGRRGRAWPS